VLHAEQRAEHVGIEGGSVGLGALFGHRAGLALGAGIVDGGFETAEAGDDTVDQRTDLLLAADVGLDKLGLGTKRMKLFRQGMALSKLRPETTTRLPLLATENAAARPMPASAPVMRTTGADMILIL
jgi:hypothetical protein